MREGLEYKMILTNEKKKKKRKPKNARQFQYKGNKMFLAADIELYNKGSQAEDQR